MVPGIYYMSMLQLVDLFGTTRDEWIARDLDGWLKASKIYEGLAEIVRHLRQQHATYMVTTKQVNAPLHGGIARRLMRSCLCRLPLDRQMMCLVSK